MVDSSSRQRRVSDKDAHLVVDWEIGRGADDDGEQLVFLSLGLLALGTEYRQGLAHQGPADETAQFVMSLKLARSLALMLPAVVD